MIKIKSNLETFLLFVCCLFLPKIDNDSETEIHEILREGDRTKNELENQLKNRNDTI